MSESDKPTSGDTNQTKNGFLALVSRLVFDEQLPVRFMYKTVPEHLNDTGWRLFTGYEDDSFLDDEATNLMPVPLDKLCGLDPTLEEKLAYNAGTVWERVPGADWERVYDFRIPTRSVDVSITNDPDAFGNQS